MDRFIHIKYYLVLLFSITFSLLSCNNEDDVNPVAGSNEAINNWIYDQMEIYYYWEDQLPTKDISNINPADYFGSLLFEDDDFSWIQPNFQELLNSLQGVNKEAGYEFIFYSDRSAPNGVLGQILYVKKGSPAELENLKRGDIIKEINGSRLTVDNYRSMLSELGEIHSLSLQRFNEETEVFEELGTIQFNTIEFAENPHFLDTVYTINNKKIGYYVYNFFALGSSSEDKSYENQMSEIFSKFESEGIQHLILDLRYNSGGAVVATIDLASHIGSNISEQDIFVKRDYNEFLGQLLIEEFGSDAKISRFEKKTAYIGNKLQNQSIIILTSSRTASASELLINGLRPYMDVFLIGETTLGKNVGSFSLFDNKDPENDWGMQPIVTKSFNSLDQSDYGNGFTPNIELRDNNLIKKQLGDINERLLARAIQELTGVVARRTEKVNLQFTNEIYSSLEDKKSFGLYTIALPLHTDSLIIRK